MEIKIIYEDIDQGEPTHINDLCAECKLFRPGTNLNSGYGCLEQDKDYPGKCYAFDCPVAYQMDGEDWEKLGEDPGNYDEDWVMPYRKVKKII